MRIELYSDYNGTHYFSSGVAGLRRALEETAHDIPWSADGESVTLDWTDIPRQLTDLLSQVYLTEDHVLAEFGPFFQDCLLHTTLAIPALREATEAQEIDVPSAFGPVPFSVLGLRSTIYSAFPEKLVTPKGKVKSSIGATSWLIPNCTAGLQIRPEVAIACCFSPLNWAFFRILKTDRYGRFSESCALVCPTNPAIDFRMHRPIEYQQMIAGGLADAVSIASLLNGGAEMHGYEYRSKAANRAPQIINSVTLAAHEGYADLLEKLPNHGGIGKGDRVFVRSNPIRALAVENLHRGLEWYANLGNLPPDVLRLEGRGLAEKPSPQARWKDKTGFESSERRRGYKAGYNAASRGRRLPELPDGDWGEGYRAGFTAGKS